MTKKIREAKEIIKKRESEVQLTMNNSKEVKSNIRTIKSEPNISKPEKMIIEKATKTTTEMIIIKYIAFREEIIKSMDNEEFDFLSDLDLGS
ncbi:MAG: hypothetical protein A3E88_05230 [Legionellales bacterium RIFCSPHIGHO2_12_FULL_35_11]|nr:MAG: hypothetical protein A3E88_05230 [Legionellales bacterium RIFCSPHIGHO2_12_FULL_35_11]